MKAQINVVTIGVADLEKSMEFYKSFGWKTEGIEFGGVVVFMLENGLALTLLPRKEVAELAGASDVADGASKVTLTYSAESETEVDEVLAKAEAAGGKITKPATKQDWGGYTGYFTDLDGVTWEAVSGLV